MMKIFQEATKQKKFCKQNLFDILHLPEIFITKASRDANLCPWNLDTLKGIRKLKNEFIIWNIIASNVEVDNEIFIWNPTEEGKRFTLPGSIII